MNWAQEQRVRWIGDMLRVYGFINRSHIERMFRVSTPQASADIKVFQRLNPGAMRLDKSAKAYVAAPSLNGEER